MCCQEGVPDGVSEDSAGSGTYSEGGGYPLEGFDKVSRVDVLE